MSYVPLGWLLYFPEYELFWGQNELIFLTSGLILTIK